MTLRVIEQSQPADRAYGSALVNGGFAIWDLTGVFSLVRGGGRALLRVLAREGTEVATRETVQATERVLAREGAEVITRETGQTAERVAARETLGTAARSEASQLASHDGD